MNPGINYYRIMQVTEDADLQVITAAYKALAKKYHPDIAGSTGSSKMQLLNEAYEVLKDPKKREEYDKKRDRSEDLRNDTAKDDTEDGSTDFGWKIITGLYPEIEKARQELDTISKELGNTFVLRLLETKEFANYNDLAKNLRIRFLKRYFGNIAAIQSLGETLIKLRLKEQAKELNEAISILGDNLSGDQISRIIARYSPNPKKEEGEKNSSTEGKWGRDYNAKEDAKTLDPIIVALAIMLFGISVIYFNMR